MTVPDAFEHEQLDLFYLGRELDPASGKTADAPFLLKSRQLTTHAAIIGMTGSGKTGLGIALLEETALDHIPAIVIDPKGDMANLLLAFPELAPADFAPWVDPDEAARQNLTPEQLAEATAARWREGLAEWGQDGERIRRLRAGAEFAVYTPGSAAGRMVSVLAGLDAPPPELLADRDTTTGLAGAAVSSLLGLVGIDADPMQSREHVLLSTIILDAWEKGQSLELPALIAAVAQPPVSQIGVFPLDSFFPPDKRMDLAMRLNTLAASPAFAAWMQGEPLDIEAMLRAPDGRPRVSIFSIAHLSDSERMFFVTLLLGRVIGWMRRQAGSSGLRALLYMDEIFGYFPPNGNPPSKQPMLLLLKQARAFGLGIALATQNPVDLDYKGMANIGSWFVGRLQTRQDQDRVLAGMGDGLPGLDRERLRALLAGLKGRQFLLCSAHLPAPVLFGTRWTLSYLKGPIAPGDLAALQSGERSASPASAAAAHAIALSAETGFSRNKPVLAGAITQYYEPSADAAPAFRAALLGLAAVRHADQRRGIDQSAKVALLAPLPPDGGPVDWASAEAWDGALEDLPADAPESARFAALPPAVSARKNFHDEAKRLADHLYRACALPIYRVKKLGLESTPQEDEAAFRERLADALEERKAAAAAAIEQDFAKKEQQAAARLQKARAKLDQETNEVRAKGLETVISVGSALLGGFLGGRRGGGVTRTTQGMRNAGQFLKERQDVQLAKEEVARLEQELAALVAGRDAKIRALDAEWAPDAVAVETIAVTPKKSDIFDARVCLLWRAEAP